MGKTHTLTLENNRSLRMAPGALYTKRWPAVLVSQVRPQQPVDRQKGYFRYGGLHEALHLPELWRQLCGGLPLLRAAPGREDHDDGDTRRPPRGGPGPVPDNWKHAVLHARMTLGETELLGADVPPDRFQPMRSAYLTLLLDSTSEAERIYALLSDGGQIFMPIEETFYAYRFAMLRDKFGTSWMLLHERPVHRPWSK